MKTTLNPLLYTLGFTLFTILLMGGCSADSESVIETSDDVEELAKYINLERYYPQKATWVHTTVGDHAESRAPGPSDYKLEALLVFDEESVQQLREEQLLRSTIIHGLRKDQLRFEWLDKKTLKLLNAGAHLSYYPPNSFGSRSLIHGGFTILDETTVLLYLFTP